MKMCMAKGIINKIKGKTIDLVSSFFFEHEESVEVYTRWSITTGCIVVWAEEAEIDRLE